MKEKKDLIALSSRSMIMVHDKIKIEHEDCNTVNSKRTKLYKYYICDYCDNEIKIEKEWHKKTGGIYDFPHIVTKSGDLELALHNKCFKEVLKLFD